MPAEGRASSENVPLCSASVCVTVTYYCITYSLYTLVRSARRPFFLFANNLCKRDLDGLTSCLPYTTAEPRGSEVWRDIYRCDFHGDRSMQVSSPDPADGTAVIRPG
jgi:hypothetical protein